MTFNPTVLFDAYISIGGNVVSDHGNKVTVNVSVADEDATTFGQTAKVRRAGLQDGSIDIDFLNDFSAAALDATFWPLLGTLVAFEIRPTSGARSATNPAYIGNVLINGWKPISGDVGKLATVSVSFPTSGATTRATS